MCNGLNHALELCDTHDWTLGYLSHGSPRDWEVLQHPSFKATMPSGLQLLNVVD